MAASLRQDVARRAVRPGLKNAGLPAALRARSVHAESERALNSLLAHVLVDEPASTSPEHPLNVDQDVLALDAGREYLQVHKGRLAQCLAVSNIEAGLMERALDASVFQIAVRQQRVLV